MQGKSENQPRMLQAINLEQMVPENYILRHIDQVIDLRFIREETKRFYTAGLGRHSIPPELVLRLFVLQYLFDLSDRALCREVALHAGFRWFCRLNFDDPVPDRTTLVKLRRLWGRNGVFEVAMRRVVERCVEAGLVSGRAVSVDGTQVTANAATSSLEAIVPVVSLSDWLRRKQAEDREEAPQEPPAGGGGDGTPPSQESGEEHRQRAAGDPNFHGERFSNQTHRSRTDPDARLYRKGGAQEAKLRYLAHQTVDLKSRVILAAGATRATGTAEREAALAMLAQCQEILAKPYGRRYCVADAGYAAGSFLAGVCALGMEPVVPWPNTTPEAIPTWQRRTWNLEQRRKRQQAVAEAEARNAVRQLQGEKLNRRLRRARVQSEHSFAEAKGCHGMGRARSRGLHAVQTQVLLTSMVQNLKRLASWLRRKQPKVGIAPMPSAAATFVHVKEVAFQQLWGLVFNSCPLVRGRFSPAF